MFQNFEAGPREKHFGKTTHHLPHLLLASHQLVHVGHLGLRHDRLRHGAQEALVESSGAPLHLGATERPR